MIQAILPAAVASAEVYEDDASAPLFPGEATLVAGAVPTRRREFATTRLCARRALGELGFAPVPITRATRGAPNWPDGIVGSMTHCAGYRAAAVARSSHIVAVGIDAEPHKPLPTGVLRLAALPSEQAALQELAANNPHFCWDTLLFCAKEATYKAWYPLTNRWLGFDDVKVTTDPDSETFVAHIPPVALANGQDVRAFTGRWTVARDLVVVATG